VGDRQEQACTLSVSHLSRRSDQKMKCKSDCIISTTVVVTIMSSKIKTNKAKVFGRRNRSYFSLSLIFCFLWFIITFDDNNWTIVVVAARRNKEVTNQGNNHQSNDDWRNWNYYQILGLEDRGDVSTSKKRKRKDRAHIGKAQIKSAFRKQAQIYHPDKVLQRQQEQQQQQKPKSQEGNPTISIKEATDRFVAISQAYETLVDEKLRADYDKKISSSSPNHIYDESSHHAYTDTFQNYNDILGENQIIDVYSSPLQSPNGIFVAYLTPQCEFVIRRLHGFYYYDYNDESSIIWKTTKDAFHDQYGYSLYSTDRCIVKLSGPKLSVLFHQGLYPLTVWESTTPILDDDDDYYDQHEEDYYLGGSRRRTKRRNPTYYMKLTDEGVLVIYRKRTYRTQQKLNTKVNLARGFQRIIQQAAKTVKTSLFSKIRNSRSSSKSHPNEHEESVEEDDECMWSSDGIAGRGGCTVYAIRKNVAVLQSSIIHSFSIAWVGTVQKLENILHEEWADLDYLMKMAVDVGRLGRNWISKSYMNVKQAIRQQHERARERVDLH
jgi:curved DNA-binding protein CbpA